jgi:methylmalonyl-CoA mutase cobalamin-binding subunit
MASSSYYLNHNPERRKRNPRRLLAAVSLTLHQPLEEYLQRATASGESAHKVLQTLHGRLTTSLAQDNIAASHKADVVALCTVLQSNRQAALELVSSCTHEGQQ